MRATNVVFMVDKKPNLIYIPNKKGNRYEMNNKPKKLINNP